jgi:hypothetical protein
MANPASHIVQARYNGLTGDADIDVQDLSMLLADFGMPCW